jgi:hypothetical protein
MPDWSRIPIPALPGEARSLEFSLAENFQKLQHFEDNFRHDLELFDRSFEELTAIKPIPNGNKISSDYWQKFRDQTAERQRYISWAHSAARDGAFNIYHFGKIIDAINYQLSSREEFSAQDIRARLKAAHILLRKHFPRMEGIRNVAGHLAEFSQEEERAKHAFTGEHEGPGIKIDAKRTALLGVLDERTYSVTFKGEVLSYEISQTTLEHLREVKMAFFTVFGPLKQRF